MANGIELSFHDPKYNEKWESILNDDILKGYTSESIIQMIMGKITKQQKEKEQKIKGKKSKNN